METKSRDASGDAAPRRAGVVLNSGLGRHFVPADVACKIISRPTVTPVPGSEFGMALVSGQVVAVIELGSPTGSLLVCEADGQLLALSGMVAEHCGFFEAAAGGVRLDGEVVAELDVTAMARSVSRRLSGASGEDEAPS